MMSLNHEVLCREHFNERLETISSIKGHLEKKDTLNERLDFLTRFGLRFEEAFSVCEEVRNDIVCEEDRKESIFKKVRNNNNGKDKKSCNETDGVTTK